MDYISRYGFEFNPYTKSQKSFLIETSQYREVISRLNYLDQVKGFGLITGQPGMGKTTAIRNWPDLSIRLRTRLYTSLFQLLQ